ncbi:hypothetical protein DM02DRAFT_614141 [Periconia macrospinosa]|uniref:Uncharacterized protein n=1 Tax=Periconia macrospinosa TaxID=97972 RepID=A0A2V1DTU6_9PLEO|nr:hypothetical protein DM02DRAFT_614141 [Periconia macrospinosa]
MRYWIVACLYIVLRKGSAVPQTSGKNVLSVVPQSSTPRRLTYGYGPPENPTPTAPAASSTLNICGWWLEGQKTSYWVCSPSSCAVATYTTPNILFCPQNEVPPYTEYFAYGQWPKNGCQGYQWCCEKEKPYAVQFAMNNGATILSGCLSSTRNDPILTQTFVTQLGTLSARHSTYTLPYSLTSAAPTAKSEVTPSQTAQSTSSGQPTPTPQAAEKKEEGLNTEAKVGLGVGIPGAVVAAAAIVRYCMRMFRAQD